jgi:hypothetical protein
MLPTLRPGDVVLATRDASPAQGSIVVFVHPDREGMWLVKRATAVADGEAWVESDNADATLADSRTLGWVPTAGMYRVIAQYRKPLRLTRPGREPLEDLNS